jgi:hypothetical protein
MNYLPVKFTFIGPMNQTCYCECLVSPDSIKDMGIRVINKQFETGPLIDWEVFPEYYQKANLIIKYYMGLPIK